MNVANLSGTVRTRCERTICACAIAIGLILSGLSLATGVAEAEPGGPDVRPQHAAAPLHEGPSGPGGRSPGGWDRRGPGVPEWGERGGPPPRDLAWRGIDQGRFDHRPFSYNGTWVQPIYNPDLRNWGFWFLGAWIPL